MADDDDAGAVEALRRTVALQHIGSEDDAELLAGVVFYSLRTPESPLSSGFRTFPRTLRTKRKTPANAGVF